MALSCTEYWESQDIVMGPTALEIRLQWTCEQQRFLSFKQQFFLRSTSDQLTQGVPWSEQRWRGGGDAASTHNKDWRRTGKLDSNCGIARLSALWIKLWGWFLFLQSIRSPLGEGLLGMCLGEKRRLLIPEKELKNKYKEVGFSLRFFYRTILFSRYYQTSLIQSKRSLRPKSQASTECPGKSKIPLVIQLLQQLWPQCACRIS